MSSADFDTISSRLNMKGLCKLCVCSPYNYFVCATVCSKDADVSLYVTLIVNKAMRITSDCIVHKTIT